MSIHSMQDAPKDHQECVIHLNEALDNNCPHKTMRELANSAVSLYIAGLKDIWLLDKPSMHAATTVITRKAMLKKAAKLAVQNNFIIHASDYDSKKIMVELSDHQDSYNNAKLNDAYIKQLEARYYFNN